MKNKRLLHVLFDVSVIIITLLVIIYIIMFSQSDNALSYIILTFGCFFIYLIFKVKIIKPDTTKSNTKESTLEHENLQHKVELYISDNDLNKKYISELKGFMFYDTRSLIDRKILQEYSSLKLNPEPDNKQDPNAVAIYFNSEKIGYVERTKTKGALKLFNDGFSFCYIHRLKIIYSDKLKRDLYFIDITIPYKF